MIFFQPVLDMVMAAYRPWHSFFVPPEPTEVIAAEVKRLIADIADRRRAHRSTHAQQEQLRALRVEQMKREIAHG